MFTLEQINNIHDRLGNAETLLQYLEALRNIGVNKYDSFIADGHSEYFGKGGHKVISRLCTRSSQSPRLATEEVS
jgi:uncharacterized protein DUF1398